MGNVVAAGPTNHTSLRASPVGRRSCPELSGSYDRKSNSLTGSATHSAYWMPPFPILSPVFWYFFSEPLARSAETSSLLRRQPKAICPKYWKDSSAVYFVLAVMPYFFYRSKT
jgi:hypothetical protein